MLTVFKGFQVGGRLASVSGKHFVGKGSCLDPGFKETLPFSPVKSLSTYRNPERSGFLQGHISLKWDYLHVGPAKLIYWNMAVTASGLPCGRCD